jgi:hypothetical protein
VLTSAQLGSYDSIKHNLLMQWLGVKEGFWLHFGVSMISGLITTTASNPCKFASPFLLSSIHLISLIFAQWM